MSPGEVVGLALTAGLVGGVIGAVLVALVATRRESHIERRACQADAWAKWLAARLTLSRACGAFVVSFRVLAGESRDSSYFSLRMHEAQRSRGQWSDAMRQLDLAEAALMAEGLLHTRARGRFPADRIGPEALRRAIEGTELDVDRLHQALRESDRLAMEYVREATGSDGRRAPQAWREVLSRTRAYLESIIDHWGAQG
jgi:hypothetical protein